LAKANQFPLQYALEKQVLNKFQIPQFRRAQVVQWADHPFPVSGLRFESKGTLTNSCIVHPPTMAHGAKQGDCLSLQLVAQVTSTYKFHLEA
jgi:hypothetical protein